MRTNAGLICTLVCLLAGAGEARATTLSVCDSVANNLVANCGFETGDFTSWTLSGNDVPGEAGNLYGVEGVDPSDMMAPNSGNYQAFFGDLVSNATTLSQTIATTAGDSYSVSFFLAQDTTPSSEYPNELTVSFGGTTLASLTQVAEEGYTQYSYNANVVAAMSVLSITLGNDLGEFLLDDVQVVDTSAVVTEGPEPATGLLLLGGGMVLGAGRRWRG